MAALAFFDTVYYFEEEVLEPEAMGNAGLMRRLLT